MRAKRCEACDWWFRYVGPRVTDLLGHGECRRKSPIPDHRESQMTFTAAWPLTVLDDWCGEWAAKTDPGEG